MGRMLSILVFIACLFTGAFGADKDTLVSAWPVNAGPLNPHLYSPNQMYAQNMVYEPLVRFNGEGVEPALAESWQVSNSGRTYTFHLKKGVKFSDGTDFNSKAVAMNFEAIMANAQRHSWIALVSMIDGWQMPDEHTFILNLKDSYNNTLFELSMPRPFRFLAPSGFLDGEINTSKGIKAPIGTGAWALKESKLSEYDLFEVNEYYHGKKPFFKNVLMRVIPDPNGRILALETGNVDILLGEDSFSMENFVRLGKNPKFTAVKSAGTHTNTIAMNTARPVTGDVNVRKAILHGIDYETILKAILLDIDEYAPQLYKKELPFCDIELSPYDYNPQEASALLDEAGWKKSGAFRKKNGQTLSIDLNYVGTDAKEKAIAEVIQAYLQNIGIKVELKAQQASIFYSLQANGNFDMIFNKTWGPPFEPLSFTASMRKPSHADYQAQLGLASKKEIDAAIEATLVNRSEIEVEELYKYILSEIHNSAVYILTSYGVQMALYNTDIVGNFQFGKMNSEFMFHKMVLK